MTRKRPSISMRVSTVVGSSRMSTRASWTRALQISTSCFWAAERSAIRASGSMEAARSASSSPVLRRMAARSRLPHGLRISSPR